MQIFRNIYTCDRANGNFIWDAEFRINRYNEKSSFCNIIVISSRPYAQEVIEVTIVNTNCYDRGRLGFCSFQSISSLTWSYRPTHTLPPLTLPLWIFVCNLSCAPAPQTSEVVEADHNNPSELTSATANTSVLSKAREQNVTLTTSQLILVYCSINTVNVSHVISGGVVLKSDVSVIKACYSPRPHCKLTNHLEERIIRKVHSWIIKWGVRED